MIELNQINCEPICRHFGSCGGCQYQNISYSEQLIQKEHLISATFNQPTSPIIPSAPWHYRNKMEFTFGQAKSGEKFLGLLKKRGRVEDLSECHLTSPWFIKTLSDVRSWWHHSSLKAYHPFSNSGDLRTLTLREGIRTGEKMLMLTIADVSFEAADFLAALSEVDTVIVRRQIIQKKVPTRFESQIIKGAGYIHEKLLTQEGQALQFRIRGPSFFQPNSLQAEKIYQYAIRLAEMKGHEKVLDLYCGTATLGIFASTHADEVLGIEMVEEAVADAEINMSLNKVGNMQVWLGDVAQLLPNIPFQPDVVFVDPPRCGLGSKAIEHLLQIRAPKIIYISCNPITQAQDYQQLLTAYSLSKIQPVDQFPQTKHIENIILLTLN